MAFQFSVGARDAALDAVEAAAGAAPTLEIRSGAVPATTATADAGTLLASMALPSDWLTAASGGSKAKLGTWEAAAAAATGTAGHFRIKQGGTTHIQGTITLTGGGGDLQLDNLFIFVNQTVTVSAFTLTAGGA